MKAILEFEAARRQKLPLVQEPPVSVPLLGAPPEGLLRRYARCNH
jgi:hypothetical protein